MNSLKRFYENAIGYALVWLLVGLVISLLLSLKGGVALQEFKDKFFEFGVICVYGGIIAGIAPHTRFKYTCHNWWLAVIFAFMSHWPRLITICESAPQDCAAIISFLVIWLVYSKIDKMGLFHEK